SLQSLVPEFGGDAGAGIGQCQLGLFVIGVQCEPDLPTGRGVLDGIIHQVANSLGDQLCIACHVQRAVGNVATQPDFRVLGQRLVEVDDIGADLGQVQALPL